MANGFRLCYYGRPFIWAEPYKGICIDKDGLKDCLRLI